REVVGEVFLSFVAAIAFATILAVVAGLTIAASSAFAHDIWFAIVKGQQDDERGQLLVAPVTAAAIGVVAIVVAIAIRSVNVTAPTGFLAAVAGTLLGRDPVAEAAYSELNVRANTGLGAL